MIKPVFEVVKEYFMINGVKSSRLVIGQEDFIAQVDQFVYLAGLIITDGKSQKDMQRRIEHISQEFGRMNQIQSHRE